VKGSRRLSYVQRWAIVPKIRNQSVAEHSYYVALYTKGMCDTMGLSSEETTEALSYALVHDMAEAFTGDIPSPLKRRLSDYDSAEKAIKHWMMDESPATSSLTKKLVKIADLLDAVVWLTEEEGMGNTRLTKLRREITKLLERAIDSLGADCTAADVEDFVSRIIKEAEKEITWYAA